MSAQHKDKSFVFADDLSKLISAKAGSLHTILLGVGGTCDIEHILDQFEQLGLDHHRAIELAQKLHTHSECFLQPGSGARESSSAYIILSLLASEAVGGQTDRVMQNIAAILDASGATFENVVKTTILLEDMSYFPEVNARYGKHFPSNPPARATFAGYGPL
eukprot:487792-Pelagomonas_calceolata.AAC.2